MEAREEGADEFFLCVCVCPLMQIHVHKDTQQPSTVWDEKKASITILSELMYFDRLLELRSDWQLCLMPQVQRHLFLNISLLAICPAHVSMSILYQMNTA